MPQLIKRSRLLSVPLQEQGKKFLVFTLGNEDYAIDILKVQEIKGSKVGLTVKEISDVPKHIKGIIYLHNSIIPIIDLRVFYHPEQVDFAIKIIIILNITKKLIGIVVDSVTDIIELTPEQIKPAPDFVDITHHEYINGVGTVNDQLLLILDIDKLIYSEELQVSKLVQKNEIQKL